MISMTCRPYPLCLFFEHLTIALCLKSYAQAHRVMRRRHCIPAD